METRKAKAEYLAYRKCEIATTQGCAKCGEGLREPGFEKYWSNDQYNARRFVFKYTDPRASDVPVAQLSRLKNTTFHSIDEALARCVILCRTCSDPRQAKKEMTQCQEVTTQD